MDRMKFETPDLVAGNIEKIGELFPGCITETRGKDGKLRKAINFDLLKQMLSADVAEGDEAYEFTWVGKKAAIAEANRPIRKTLRPCPEESVDWDTTENLYIEGDNLEVLKLLQESYLGKVKMIYIDPPYNTGNDFIYRDDFAMKSDEYEEQLGMFDEETGDRLFKNTDSNGRFHSDWCSMMLPRLTLARNLLSNDGIMFVSIDDNEYSNLFEMCREVFGASNYLATFVWQKKYGPANDAKGISETHEYILTFGKNAGEWQPGLLARNEVQLAAYKNPDNDPRGVWRASDLSARTYSASCDYEIVGPTGKRFLPPPSRSWIINKDRYEQLLNDNRITFGIDGTGRPMQKTFLSEAKGGITPETWLPRERGGDNKTARYELKEVFPENIFDTPKPTKLLLYLLQITGLSKDSLIVDFFSGSATTAHAVMQLNAEDGGHRKFIMVQLPEKTDEDSEAYKAGYKNICEIGKERIRRAGQRIKKPIVELADLKLALADLASEKEENVKEAVSKQFDKANSLDVGFRVLKLADSNMEDVYYSADEITQEALAEAEMNIKPDRTDLDLLFGCLLEWGLSLSLPYKSEEIEGCKVHTYNDGDLVACFDRNIPESVIRSIAKRRYDGRCALRAVFRDISFASSPEKINVEEIFKLLSPDTRVKVI